MLVNGKGPDNTNQPVREAMNRSGLVATHPKGDPTKSAQPGSPTFLWDEKDETAVWRLGFNTGLFMFSTSSNPLLTQNPIRSPTPFFTGGSPTHYHLPRSGPHTPYIRRSEPEGKAPSSALRSLQQFFERTTATSTTGGSYNRLPSLLRTTIRSRGPRRACRERMLMFRGE